MARILASYKPPPERTDAAADGSLDVPIEVHPAVLERVGGRVAKKTHDETKRLVGISRTGGNVDKKTLAKWRKTNTDLIKTLGDTQKDQLGDILDEATDKGWHVKELREKIQERFDVTKSHADLIARDQTLKLNGQLTKARQTAVGIEKFIWSTSSDERVREEHAALDGQVFSWDDLPTVDDEDDVMPGAQYQCRCVAVAIVPWLDEDGGEDEEAA